MKTKRILTVFMALTSLSAYGTFAESGPRVLYVSKTGEHTAPFISMATAATNIQAAVNLSSSGDIILVDDGIYDSGSYPTPNGEPQMNRLVIDHPLTLCSINGPAHTTIAGSEDEANTRCVYMTNGVTLTGFTIRNGRVAQTSPFSYHYSNRGGGVMMDHGGVLRNCIVTDCFADNLGGGIACHKGGLVEHCEVTENSGMHGGNIQSDGGTVRNCIITHGSSYIGGGILITDGTVQHCTLYGNRSSGEGGGINCGADVTVQNCIVYDNIGSTYYHDSRNILSRADRSNTIEYTCSEPLIPGAGNTDLPPKMRAPQIGNYRLRSDSPCIDAAMLIPELAFDYAYASRLTGGSSSGTNQPTCDMGALEYDSTETHWVDAALGGTNGNASIQQAVDTADPEDEIIVADGDYSSEMSITPAGYDSHTRLVVDKPVAIRSMNGAAYTSIQGSTNYTRCVYLSKGASLEGFTLLGGKAHRYGGGALLDKGGLLTQCILRDNLALSGGGGAYMIDGGIVEKSIFTDNSALHGAGVQCEQGRVENCLMKDNTSYRGGGLAIRDGVAQFCTIVNNRASGPGGGVDASGTASISSCIIVSNQANNFPGETNDCSNWCSLGTNVDFRITCTTPMPDGWLCFTDDPLFCNPVIDNYQLSISSPCIDRTSPSIGTVDDINGTSRYTDGDFDGRPDADVGAYEYNPRLSDSDNDSLSDADEVLVYMSDPLSSDSDNDGMTDGQEILGGYSPNDANSALVVTAGSQQNADQYLTRSLDSSTSDSELIIQWQSVPGKTYNVLRTTDLQQEFTVIQSSITATTDCTVFVDSGTTTSSCYYYKIELAQ